MQLSGPGNRGLEPIMTYTRGEGIEKKRNKSKKIIKGESQSCRERERERERKQKVRNRSRQRDKEIESSR